MRRRAEPTRATFLELFFDLVFVFALTRVSQRLVEGLAADRQMALPVVGQTALLLLALWLVWTDTAWMTSRYDPRRLPVQLVIVAVMFAGMIMAVGVSEAFGGRGLVFAVAYVVAQVGRPLALHARIPGARAAHSGAAGLLAFTEGPVVDRRRGRCGGAGARDAVDAGTGDRIRRARSRLAHSGARPSAPD